MIEAVIALYVNYGTRVETMAGIINFIKETEFYRKI